jgi:hypothetical protein
MSDEQTKNDDPLIDDVRQTRRRLVEQHGGLRGWVKHLQELQSQRADKLVRLRQGSADRGPAGS